MSVIECADIVLRLLALGWGVSLVALYPDAITTWAERLHAWRAEHLDHPGGKR